MSDNEAWIREDRDHLYRMEQEKTKQVQTKADGRNDIAAIFAILVGIIAVVGLIVGAIWTTVAKDSQRSYEKQLECTRSGGTIFKIESSGPVCLHLRSE